MQHVETEITIETLVVEDDRPTHIARHQVSVDEVVEILTSSYVYLQGKFDRILIIGKTENDRFLTIVVGKRDEPHTYGLVTARPARTDERQFFEMVEQTQGGENKDEDKT